MKGFVIFLAILMVGLWLYGTFQERSTAPKPPTFSTDSPRESLETFFQAVKRKDPKGIALSCERESYGMNAMNEIHSYETAGLDRLEMAMPIQGGDTGASGSVILVGVDDEIVTTLHFEMKKIDGSWKITGMSTVGGLKKPKEER